MDTTPFVSLRMQGQVPPGDSHRTLSAMWVAASNKRDEGKPPGELQSFLFDPVWWWDNKRSNLTRRDSDFSHMKSKVAPRVNKRAWVDLELATWDSGMKASPESVSISLQGEEVLGRLELHGDHLDIGMCCKLCDDGQITDAADVLNLVVQQGCRVDNNIFYRVLKRCTAHKDLELGRRIHALSIKCGYDGDAFLATHLIGLYASHDKLEEALQVFTKVSTPDAYNWAAIIFAYARRGQAAKAIQLYRQMCESTVKPDNRIYSAVLKACATAGDLPAGKEVHSHIVSSRGRPDMFVQTGLVDMYAKCGSLEDARKVFDVLSQRDVVTWNTMLAGYTQQGMGQEAISLYTSMQHEGITAPDSFTFSCLLQACASAGFEALAFGKQLHAQIEEGGLHTNGFVGTCLMNMYAKCGAVEDARSVFDRLPDRDVVTWTAMIADYVQLGMGEEALSLYNGMQKRDLSPPTYVTYVCLLQACASVGLDARQQGKQLHDEIEQLGFQANVVVGTCLIDMYAKTGSLEDARSVFDKLPQREVVTWTAMISAYAQQGRGQEALALYGRMQQEEFTPNLVTFVCLLHACASVAALHQGKQLHMQIEERGLQADVIIGGSLVNMYAKCGSLEDSRAVFDRLLHRNVVTWTAMIAGYVQQGMDQEALQLYSRMQQEGITPPDSITFVCLLQACALVAALPLGKQLHAQIDEKELQADLVVGAALVNMYAKCGSMFDAQQVFDSLPNRTIEAWGALIGGYSHQGDSQIVFDLLDKMGPEGVLPNGITFLNVLAVCSHVGLVEKGRKYFEAMSTDYGISPDVEHYTCMVDLLGRAGHLVEALQMAKTMPFLPDGAVWLTLLAASLKWNNVEIGQQAFKLAVSVDGKDPASYVLMSNIYARAQMWEEAKELEARRLKSGAWKQPGKSWWTDMGGVVHTFVVGDKTHPEIERIYARLEQFDPKMRKSGSVPDHSSAHIMHDQMDAELCRHSENLAIA